VRTVGVRLTADVSQYMSGLKRAGAATKDFAGQIDGASKAGKLDKVADQAAHFGLIGAAAFGMVVKSAADFDKQMSAVSAATHANSKDLDLLRQAAMKAGKDTQFSATQAAQGITELSKAGVGTADILGGGLKGALDLAAAGQISVGEAAETAASALTQFKLQGKDVPHVADLLAAAAGKAQGTVHDMGMALNQAGLVASQTGLSIEDTTGTLAAFASAGLIGSDAGTSFKTMLLAIQNPSQKTADMMQELGISAYDAQGNFVGIAKFAGILQDKLKGLTPQVRAQAMAQIFGNDAVRAANILYTQGQSGIDGWVNKVNDAGYASVTASKLTDNLAGDLERLKGSVETLAISSGSGANGGLRVLAKALNQLVNEFLSMPRAVGSTLTVMAGVGGVAALAFAGFVKLRKGLADANKQLIAMGPAGELAAGSLQKVTAFAGRAGAVLAGFQVASMGAAAALGSDLNPKVDALGQSMASLAGTGKVGGEAARLFGGDLGKLDTAMKDVADTGRWSSFARGFAGSVESMTGTGAVFDNSLQHSKERLESLDQALQQLVSSGHADQAAQVFNAIADRARKQGVSVNELKAALPGYAAALDNAGAAAKGAGKQTGDLNSALQTGASGQKQYASATAAAAAAARGELSALSDLSAKMKAETDPVFGLLNAQKSLTDAEKAASKAIRDHGKNSDQAKAATQRLALAAIDLQDKVGAASGTLSGKMSSALVQTLRLAGLNDKEIAILAGQFRKAKTDADKYGTALGKLPKNVPTKFSTPGLPQSDKGVKDYDKKLDALARQIRTQVNVVGVSGAEAQLKNLLIQQQALKKGISVSAARSAFNKNAFAGGGWTGPGGQFDEAGVVHADEFVIKKSSRQRIEKAAPGLLDRMNESGEVGYAGGGRVLNVPFPVNAAITRIPSKAEAMAAVMPAATGAGGAIGWRAMVALAHAAFPGLGVYSTFRPGAHTLTGNLSYHALGRAVDFAPSKPFARWVNAHYMGKTKELITPWQSLNIWNGRRHHYSAIVENQHNFAGGNAHDHWAMKNGGTIREPVFGVGASGDTYSLGENWQPERVTPAHSDSGAGGITVNVSFSGPVGSQYELDNWLVGSVNRLKSRARI
jgi:TP901 family phage tail tape measure protein